MKNYPTPSNKRVSGFGLKALTQIAFGDFRYPPTVIHPDY